MEHKTKDLMEHKTKDLLERIARLEKRLAREKSAREQAESLLEQKSLDLYMENKTLNQHAKLMEAAIVHAKDAVIITKANMEDGGPEIVYVNDAFTRLTGYEFDEVIGKTPRILQGPGTSKATLAEIKQTLMNGKPFKGELQNYTKDGIAYWLEISIAPVKDDAGNITHYAAIERDITKRKAFEKELQINREAAEVANRAKGDFLANMSHELRTPMNGIIGLSELLMDMDVQEDARELANAVNASSRNLLILLNDILDLSKIEAGELTLENIPFNIRRAINQTADLLKPMALKKGISLDCHIDAIVPTRIVTDPARLQQMINNLVSNAIKFTDEGFVKLKVEIDADAVGDAVLVFHVQDTGIGIPEDKHESVFKKFTQADVSTARKYGGTGLGLAITKQLAQAMGGAISLQSKIGKGTTFTVELPIEIPANQEIFENKVEAANATRIDTSGRLLVVDDHPVNLLFMNKVLKKIGFTRVDQAASGKEALELAKIHEYDLIFMDCQMPEMDGFEASERIRMMEGVRIGSVPIIAVTADAMKGARERCLDSGMNDYISKPIDIEKLKDILCKWQLLESNAVDTLAKRPRTEASPLIVDWERIKMFTGDSDEETQELIAMFTFYAEQTLGDLKRALETNDAAAWEKAAHKFKGSSANFGAQALCDVCFKAEQSHQAEYQEKSTVFDEVLAAYKVVQTEIAGKLAA